MGDQVRLTAKKMLAKRNNPVPRTQRATLGHPLNSPADQILNLQRTIGNQAVQRMLNAGVIQAKLKIGEPNDIYEQEADRVADQVMQMPEPKIQRQGMEEEEEAVQVKQLPSHLSPQVPNAMHTPANSAGLLIQRVYTECEEEMPRQSEEEDELVQTKPLLNRQFSPRETPIRPKGVGAPTPQVSGVTAANIQALNSGGSPLPRSIRSVFEPRFGADFSQVRVHTDTRAAETAKSINARAFTVGRNIAFGASQYAPESHEGRQLLAHELTHVVQQNGSQLQRGPLRGTGKARQVASLLGPDLGTKGSSETPVKGLSAPGVNSDGLARRGLGQREAISRRPDTRGNPGIVRLNFLSTTCLSRTIQRWRMGRGASPPGEPNFRPVTRNHQARVFAALRLLSRIVRRRRCRNYFRDNCPGGTSRTVGNLFFNRMVVWALHENGSLGGNTGDHVAYEDPYLWRIGHWAIAGALLHEMMHACGIGTSAAEEVTCETAIERCHNYTPFIESASPLSGSVGTTITITGFGFGMSQGRFDRVLFNGVNAGAAMVWRYGHGVGSEIQVRVPRGATTGSLVVINNGVRSNTRQFTVTP